MYPWNHLLDPTDRETGCTGTWKCPMSQLRHVCYKKEPSTLIATNVGTADHGRSGEFREQLTGDNEPIWNYVRQLRIFMSNLACAWGM